MASVQRMNNFWYCQFGYRSNRRTFTLGSVNQTDANGKQNQVQYLLPRLKRRLIYVPLGIEIVEFVQHDIRPVAHDHQVFSRLLRGH
jgi:hypothetical protein